MRPVPFQVRVESRLLRVERSSKNQPSDSQASRMRCLSCTPAALPCPLEKPGSRLSKARNSHGPGLCKTAPMPLDPLELVQGLGS